MLHLPLILPACLSGQQEKLGPSLACGMPAAFYRLGSGIPATLESAASDRVFTAYFHSHPTALCPPPSRPFCLMLQ